MSCKYCEDEYGISCFPQYGLAPHKHIYTGNGFIGSTIFLPKSEWPDNFTEDLDEIGMGTWSCPYCGHGK